LITNSTTVTQFEVRVQYLGQRDTTRFVEATREDAMRTAETLFKLTATVRVWVNEVTITNTHKWEK
jgi:hypothetical protein